MSNVYKVIPVHYQDDQTAYRVVEVSPKGILTTMTVQRSLKTAEHVAKTLSRVASTIKSKI